MIQSLNLSNEDMVDAARNMGQPATPYNTSVTINEDIEIPGSTTSPQQTQKPSPQNHSSQITEVTAILEQHSQFQPQENNLGADSQPQNLTFLAVNIPSEKQHSKTTESSQQNERTQKLNQSKTYAGEMLEKTQAPSGTQALKAPTLDQMNKIVGYESVGFIGLFMPPPLPNSESKGQEPIRDDFSNSSNFPIPSAIDLRNALVDHVSDHCCYGKGAARNMTFNDIKNTSAVHYALDTFGERREIFWTFKPYSGEEIDSPANGPAPGPWEVSVPMNEPYVNKVVEVEVPHTASVRLCHDCGGSGLKICGECFGRGRVSCPHCHGNGRKPGPGDNKCTWCNGMGKERCNLCAGTGQLVCKSCDGKKQLKWFIKLTTFWKVHMLDYIIEKTSMPNDLVQTASGQIIFEEEAFQVWPVTNFPDDELNIASYNCVQKHRDLQKIERVVSQRQKIRVIPVAQVNYKWKAKDENFFVYGFEKKVYSPNYPEKCCWGCNIV